MRNWSRCSWGRIRTLYNPLDYPPLEAVRSQFTCSWQYVSYGVPHQLREVSERMFQHERENGETSWLL